MRKTLICSSICLVLAGTGLIGYRRTHPALAAAPQTSAPVAAVTTRPATTTAVPALAAARPERRDHTALTAGSAKSGEHFPDTPVGRALDQHLRILVDVSPGADDRKARSLAALRKQPREASQALVDAYHSADPADAFGRWLISLTLGELQTDDGYAGLQEIAHSAIPASLKDNDREGTARANESAIRQNAAGGLAALARAGNTAAEQDLLRLALDPPSGDAAVRTLAIKGYLAAGDDYAARVQTLKSQLPRQYHDVVTLTVSQPEDATPPDYLPTTPKHGG